MIIIRSRVVKKERGKRGEKGEKKKLRAVLSYYVGPLC